MRAEGLSERWQLERCSSFTLKVMAKLTRFTFKLELLVKNMLSSESGHDGLKLLREVFFGGDELHEGFFQKTSILSIGLTLEHLQIYE